MVTGISISCIGITDNADAYGIWLEQCCCTSFILVNAPTAENLLPL